MVIKPLDKEQFTEQLEKSENYGVFSEATARTFYDWMYTEENGYVQSCAFLIPNGSDSNLPDGQDAYVHALNEDSFIDFCSEYSGLWRYQVYAGVNTLPEKPEYGRGTKEHIEQVNTFTLDIETKRKPHTGASHEAIWWSYKYALAQVKYFNELLDVWPMVVMSENGIHLHYKADLPVEDRLLHKKQHRVTKFLTKLAMNNDYVNKIKQQAPERIEFSPDDVSDVPRVMKVPGTLGIKSEANRLCAIIHKPSKSNCGSIGMDILDDYYIPEFTNGGSSESNTPNKVELEATHSDLDNDLQKRINDHCKEDRLFEALWSGDTSLYDNDRSQAEFAFIKKLLSLGYSQKQIQQVMSASGMSKWDEEPDHYKRKTLTSALEEFDGTVKADRHTSSISLRTVGE